MCYKSDMKTYIHARLAKQDRAVLEELKQATGRSESDIVRRGLKLLAEEQRQRVSALQLAGRSVGRFKKGPRDLSRSRKHLEGFGE
jgi:Arc/MetJ-type ribon-helix-helix transcriptional regulator